MKNHCINLTSLGFAILALVLHIVCMVTPYYVTIDFPKFYMYVEFGMFISCTVLEPEDKDCGLNGDKSLVGLNRVAQAMSVIGVILLGIGIFLLLPHVCKASQGDRQRLLPRFILAFCGTGAFLILLSDGLIVKHFHDFNFDVLTKVLGEKESKFNWGFYLDIVAGVLALLASVSQAVAMCVSRSQESGIV